ncbi:TrgA family protein [Shimia sp. Alg240-R146]|uniref:TrgA family protein n=1 Tax=Shimia sp. Alg240-R146 TaxID=2993449 RepID=UPI0022E29A05|nr:TrgA family protein [Shimia sp. Alg240-R146]
MPTANKLVAALCLAIIGALGAELVKPQLPEGFNPGAMTLVAAAVGLCVGWVIMGPKAHRAGPINNGITGIVALVFVELLVFGSYEMLQRALKRHYTEPIEAIEQIVAISIEYGAYLTHPVILVMFAIGAFVSGFLTDYARRRWG